jgi:hypothetical protein
MRFSCFLRSAPLDPHGASFLKGIRRGEKMPGRAVYYTQF